MSKDPVPRDQSESLIGGIDVPFNQSILYFQDLCKFCGGNSVDGIHPPADD